MNELRSNPDVRTLPALSDAPPPDEALVADPRGGLSPAQMVDRRLAALRPSGTLAVGRFQATVLPHDLSRG